MLMSEKAKLAAENRVKSHPALSEDVQIHLGKKLRSFYASDAPEDSQRLDALLNRLEAVLVARGEALTAEVRAGLVATMPMLRRFAISLAKDPVRADDLVQEALMKGWRNRQSFHPGSNIEAWLFTILRNVFYTQRRVGAREEDDPNDERASRLSVPASQGDQLDLQDVYAAVGRLPTDQREAIIFIVLDGMTYEEAAIAAGCKLGTIKSRVSRARASLLKLLGYEALRYGAIKVHQAGFQPDINHPS